MISSLYFVNVLDYYFESGYNYNSTCTCQTVTDAKTDLPTCTWGRAETQGRLRAWETKRLYPAAVGLGPAVRRSEKAGAYYRDGTSPARGQRAQQPGCTW